MPDVISLAAHKQKKLNDKFLEDIKNILLVLSYTERALTLFKYYGPVQEILGVIEANKKLFEMHKKKHEENSNPNSPKK